MPPVGPTSRRVLIRGLRRLGYIGPIAAKRHMTMRHPDGRTARLPNPHGPDIDTGLLLAVLREAGISREAWELL